MAAGTEKLKPIFHWPVWSRDQAATPMCLLVPFILIEIASGASNPLVSECGVTILVCDSAT